MQIGCAKMSFIPMIGTGSETEDKMNISVAVLMMRPTFRASLKAVWFLFQGLIVFAVVPYLRDASAIGELFTALVNASDMVFAVIEQDMG